MIWEELFSWSNQNKVTYTDNSPKIIAGNTLIQHTTFREIKRNAALLITDNSYYCSIDYSSFIKCSSKDAVGSVGCIHFKLTGYGSISITRTIADSCSSHTEGNFARIQVEEFGHIFLMMTSVDQCAPDLSHDTYHSIYMFSGTQILKNVNNSRCFANRHPGFTNYLPQAAQIDFCNIADNTAGMTCVYCITGNCEVRRANIIRNHQKSFYSWLPGVVGVAYEGSSSIRVILSDCVFAGNEGFSEISVNNANITLIGCSLEREEYSEENGHVNNVESRHRDRVTMTLMGGMGKFAEIPYGEKTEKIHPKRQAVILLGFIMTLGKLM